MLKIVIGTIGVFLMVFLEHFFLGISAFSVFLLLAVITWSRVGLNLFLYLGILSAVVLDVTMHTPFGFHMLVLGILLILLSLVSSFAQLEGRLSRYAGLFLVFLGIYLINIVLLSLVSDGVMPLLNGALLLGIFFNVVISVVISFVVDMVFGVLREEKGGERIRLR